MTQCELCGRGVVEKVITPMFFPHDPVCHRARCKAAVKDAIETLKAQRDQADELAYEIAGRHKSQVVPVGYRSDEMCHIQFREDSDWWFNKIAQQVNL